MGMAQPPLSKDVKGAGVVHPQIQDGFHFFKSASIWPLQCCCYTCTTRYPCPPKFHNENDTPNHSTTKTTKQVKPTQQNEGVHTTQTYLDLQGDSHFKKKCQ